MKPCNYTDIEETSVANLCIAPAILLYKEMNAQLARKLEE